MRNRILLVTMTLLSFSSFSQTNSAILGKWKIIAVDAGIYHNYKKDSTSIPKELTESLKGNKDSSLTIGFIAAIVKAFDNYNYIFLNNGQFKETKNGKDKQAGIYTDDKDKRQITQIVKTKFGGENRQILNYQINGQILEFTIPSEEMTIKFSLERDN